MKTDDKEPNKLCSVTTEIMTMARLINCSVKTVYPQVK